MYKRQELQIIADAQAAQNPRWANAFKKAAQQLVSNPEINLIDGVLFIASHSGWIYATKPDECQCKAFDNGVPCWHRAAHKLVLEYREKHSAASLLNRLRGALPARKPQNQPQPQAEAQQAVNELFV